MSHLFYCFKTLETGAKEMVTTLKRTYQQMAHQNVCPDVEPGFLRRQLPQSAPEHGKPIQQVIKDVQNKILPGIMHWQSPKYFGYFPSSTAVTNVIASMFEMTHHSPAFNYAVSPSHTQLQNIQMDWTAKALGLPEHFLLKNSGGGVIISTVSESVFVSIHTAKIRKIKELNITLTDPVIGKLVGYFCQIAHNGAEKGLLIKDIYHRRAVKANYSNLTKNIQLDIAQFEELLKKDLDDGLIPFWFGSTYGSTLSGAIDLTPEVVDLCKKYNLWINVDAAYLGSTWICQKYRPQKGLLQQVDSISLNFAKVLLLAGGGSMMFIKDKKQLNQAFGGTAKFSFYDNKYSGQNDVVDYKDWTIGLGRRNNAIKFYFLFEHYGMENIRRVITETDQKMDRFEKMINADHNLFQVFSRRFGVICFRAKSKTGQVNQELTKSIIKAVEKIQEGFLSPGFFKGTNLLRIVIGNYSSDLKTVEVYYSKIRQVALKLQQQHDYQNKGQNQVQTIHLGIQKVKQ